MHSYAKKNENLLLISILLHSATVQASERGFRSVVVRALHAICPEFEPQQCLRN